jgi:hypothetical protein
MICQLLKKVFNDYAFNYLTGPHACQTSARYALHQSSNTTVFGSVL